MRVPPQRRWQTRRPAWSSRVTRARPRPRPRQDSAHYPQQTPTSPKSAEEEAGQHASRACAGPAHSSQQPIPAAHFPDGGLISQRVGIPPPLCARAPVRRGGGCSRLLGCLRSAEQRGILGDSLLRGPRADTASLSQRLPGSCDPERLTCASLARATPPVSPALLAIFTEFCSLGNNFS